MNVVKQVQATLEQLATTQARVGATVTLAVVAAVLAWLFAPRVVRTVHREVTGRLLANERVPVDLDSFDIGFPVTFVVRTIQLALFVLASLMVLVVWGYVDVAVAAVEAIVGTIPLFVRVLVTISLVAATLVGIDVLEDRVDAYAEESDALNQHQQGVVFRVLQVSVLVAATIASLSVWGVNLGGLLVGAGFLGIVIGTAARTTIGSLIAGFVLMFARPFEIGDWVAIGEDEGTVTDITIINTRIRNPSGEEVVIPNENVLNATVTNRTSMQRLRLSVDVGVDYDADVEAAEAVMQDALEDLNRVLSNPTPQVVPKSLGDSAVVLECRFWIDHPSPAKRAMVTADVVRGVKAALDDAGIKIPYPQRELLGREEDGGLGIDHREGRAELTRDR
ncbi:mechanosensitive ion channel family protein [Halobacterium rubrum]|uniref:mechanosensitive ion channel family protein n=1 Tax=Halobacterium TaxID=2239 RepID=UPI001F1C136E|nr:mechanosensitive ion channel family protein [Halobacterium rubrum]MDH5019114.1 mechanosensitive ion channel family protein [Halobacterium rubrum]